MRQIALTTLTTTATVLILAVLALPAKHALDRRAAQAATPARTLRTLDTASAPRRVFGVYIDAWHVDDWARAVGATPQLVAGFESFSRKRTLDREARELRRQGVTRTMIAWEPWSPVPAALGVGAQAAPQPGYRNADIAAGAQDRYILRFARSLARMPGTVYLRYAHEMNGYWYPWSADPAAYRWA